MGMWTKRASCRANLPIESAFEDPQLHFVEFKLRRKEVQITSGYLNFLIAPWSLAEDRTLSRRSPDLLPDNTSRIATCGDWLTALR
ncbi:hypothetical protein NPIL_270511 [Nephila pilipes]|uniref:Uncharacterized protein n=1 Tax=Nephila pilipes TaxID=299642 RepID=A0A8X6UAP8_NEPPI|nr:hypothetical protein NPIL_270511 [Nephila pilipes]